MEIKLELLRRYVADFIKHKIDDFEIDATQIADTIAILALSEIQKAIQNKEYTDFEIVEEIVCIFEKYHISAGSCHDF